MNIAMILSFIQLAIKAAPTARQVYEDGKELVAHLFSQGLITQAEQDALMTWADAHMEATLAGTKPPELVVE